MGRRIVIAAILLLGMHQAWDLYAHRPLARPPGVLVAAEPRQRRERPVSTRTRTRRRTRSGQPVEGGAEAPATQDGDTTEAAAAQDGDKAAADGTDEAPKAPRKRRRRRGGSGRNSSREGADGSAAAGEPVAVPAAE